MVKKPQGRNWRPRKNRMWCAALTLFFLIYASENAEPFETINIGGDGSGMAAMKVLEERFMDQFPGIRLRFVPGLNSGGARSALAVGVIDIAITSTPGNEPERLPGAVPYGKSPLVFVTSPSIQAYNLSSQELVDIYQGKKITWSNGARLRLILRLQSDSDTRILKNISHAMAEAVSQAQLRPGMRMALSDTDGADAVINTPGALGTSTLAMIVAGKRALNVLSIDGRIPSPRAIPDETYSWFKTYYIVARPGASSSARQFVGFVLSPTGQRTLMSLGHWVEIPSGGR